MAISERRDLVPAAAILALGLVVGLALAGRFIGGGVARFRSETRTVTVKGLVEKEVKADQATWTLYFRRAGADLKEAHARISADREAAVAFLVAQGFPSEAISRQGTRIIDKLAREYGENQAGDRFRYVLTSSVQVTTPDVDRIAKAVGATESLVASGVVLDGEQGGFANPRYAVTAFGALRPQLLAEATANARETARQFAADAGAAVGRIRTANQGAIQIFGSDGNDESAPYSPTSTPLKKIRVVSTFEFELR
ncbi:SIMPL domain-containing protein [bacterium]|nr:SIMPL domain-containing protein [bacterium]